MGAYNTEQLRLRPDRRQCRHYMMRLAPVGLFLLILLVILVLLGLLVLFVLFVVLLLLLLALLLILLLLLNLSLLPPSLHFLSYSSHRHQSIR